MEHNIKRGDIFFVDFGITVGSVQGRLRPVVVIQNDTGNKHSPTLIVATITSKANKKRQMPTHIVFNMEGLTRESIVQLEQITTIDKQQIIPHFFFCIFLTSRRAYFRYLARPDERMV